VHVSYKQLDSLELSHYFPFVRILVLSQRQIDRRCFSCKTSGLCSLYIYMFFFSNVDHFIGSPKTWLTAMEIKHAFLYLSLWLGFSLLHGYSAYAAGTHDGSEQWGYVEVRPSKLNSFVFYLSHFYVKQQGILLPLSHLCS
jgi:hypothetical protein